MTNKIEDIKRIHGQNELVNKETLREMIFEMLRFSDEQEFNEQLLFMESMRESNAEEEKNSCLIFHQWLSNIEAYLNMEEESKRRLQVLIKSIKAGMGEQAEWLKPDESQKDLILQQHIQHVLATHADDIIDAVMSDMPNLSKEQSSARRKLGKKVVQAMSNRPEKVKKMVSLIHHNRRKNVGGKQHSGANKVFRDHSGMKETPGSREESISHSIPLSEPASTPVFEPRHTESEMPPPLYGECDLSNAIKEPKRAFLAHELYRYGLVMERIISDQNHEFPRNEPSNSLRFFAPKPSRNELDPLREMVESFMRYMPVQPHLNECERLGVFEQEQGWNNLNYS